MNISFDLLIPLTVSSILLYLYLRLRIKKLKIYKSFVQKDITITEKYNKEKTLFIGNDAHGISVNNKSFNQSYWYQAAQILANNLKHLNDPSLLFLGLGTGAMNHAISKLLPNAKQLVIEYDQAVIQACLDYFELGKIKNTKVLNQDAFKWINETKEKFDAIVIDIYSADDFYKSGKSHTATFFKKLKFKNPEQALLIINRPILKKYLQEEEPSITKMEKELKKIFYSLTTKKVDDKPRSFSNILVIAQKLR